jgi:tetratricopeptide (TPR) repeat protein
MPDRPIDLDPEERDLAHLMGSAPMNCPGPDLLLAARSGVLPEDAASGIAAHVASCPYCQVLSVDLEHADLSRPTAEEANRIRKRLQAETKSRTWAWSWRPAAVVGLCAGVILAVALWTNRKSANPAASPAAPAIAALLPLEKAPVRLPAAGALVWRGEGGEQQKQLVADLAPALTSYRNDDYQQAVRLLQPLVAKYPDAAQPPFYLGVSLLFLDRNTEAASALEIAKQRARASFAQDAGWYLALAYQRTGQAARALEELRRLCAAEGEHRAASCSAVQQLAR